MLNTKATTIMQRTPHTSSHGKQHPSKLTLKMKSRFKNKSSFQKWKEILKGSHDIIVIHRRFTHICFLHVMNLIHIYLESQQIQNKRGFYVMYWTIPFCYWCHTGGKAKVDCSTLWHQRDPHEAGHIRPNGRSPGTQRAEIVEKVHKPPLALIVINFELNKWV